MNEYQKNAISYLRAQIKVARKFKDENNILKYNTVTGMIRENLGYCVTLGIFTWDKYSVLLEISDRMINAV